MIQQTSRDAFAAAKRHMPKTREQIAASIVARGGASIEQMSDDSGRLQNSISGCLRGMAMKGLVRDSGEETLTRYGNKAILWVLNG